MCHPCRREEPQRKQLDLRVCELCEASYVPSYALQRFCSKAHANAWNGGHRPPFTGITDRATRQKAKSRARVLRQAETWDGIGDDEILERDGWRCQIPGCKRRPIRRDVSYPHPRSKSIDHIIPLSLGGDDTAVNKRAAHLGCNIARSNRAGAEQVALFGVIRELPLVTRTATGVNVGPLRVRKPCACGNPKPSARIRCETCQKQLDADAEERRQAAARDLAEERRMKAERTAALHAEIRKLRAQGFTTRATAANLRTSQRMVTRVDLSDPVTGKLPR